MNKKAGLITAKPGEDYVVLDTKQKKAMLDHLWCASSVIELCKPAFLFVKSLDQLLWTRFQNSFGSHFGVFWPYHHRAGRRVRLARTLLPDSFKTFSIQTTIISWILKDSKTFSKLLNRQFAAMVSRRKSKQKKNQNAAHSSRLFNSEIARSVVVKAVSKCR